MRCVTSHCCTLQYIPVLNRTLNVLRSGYIMSKYVFTSQQVTAHRSTLYYVTVRRNTLVCLAVRYSASEYVVLRYGTSQYAGLWCSTLQRVGARWCTSQLVNTPRGSTLVYVIARCIRFAARWRCAVRCCAVSYAASCAVRTDLFVVQTELEQVSCGVQSLPQTRYSPVVVRHLVRRIVLRINASS